MSKKQQGELSIRYALEKSGVVAAYCGLRDNISDDIKSGIESFADHYEYLIPIRDAEHHYYALRSGKDAQEVKKDFRKFRDKYLDELREHVEPQAMLEWNTVQFYRQQAGEINPPTGTTSFNNLEDRIIGTASNVGVREDVAYQLYGQIGIYLKKVFDKEKELQQLSFNADDILALRPENLKSCGNSAQKLHETAQIAAFEIFAKSGSKKHPEDFPKLFSLWNEELIKGDETPPKKRNKPTTNNNPHNGSDTHWRDLVMAGTGTALIVGSALIPEDRRKTNAKGEPEPLSFGKVLKTTAFVLAPFVGLYLVSTALNNWQNRVANQANNGRELF